MRIKRQPTPVILSFFLCIAAGLYLFPGCQTCFAQPSVYFKSYSRHEGLPAGTITKLWKDPKGFLWLLSENGLARFDGYEFIHYRNNPADTNSLPSSTVISAFADSAGNIFFLTSRAISRYDYHTETFKTLVPVTAVNKIKVITSDKLNTVIVDDEKLYKVNLSLNTIQVFPLPFKAPLTQQVVSTIHERKLFLYTSLGAAYFDLATDTFRPFIFSDSSGNSIQPNIIRASYFCTGQDRRICYSRPGRFFVYDSQANLFKEQPPRAAERCTLRGKSDYELIQGHHLLLMSSTGETAVCNLMTGAITQSNLIKELFAANDPPPPLGGFVNGKNNRIWLQNGSAGLIELSLVKDELVLANHYNQFNSEIPTTDCNLILDYSNEIVWFYAAGKGLVKCEKLNNLFHTFNPVNLSGKAASGLNKNVRAICEVSPGTLFTASLDGIRELSTESAQFRTLSQSNSGFAIFNNNPFSTIIKDRQQNTWISSWNEPVIFKLNYEKNTCQKISLSETIRNYDRFTFKCALLDDGVDLYFGTSSGDLLKVNTASPTAEHTLIRLQNKDAALSPSTIFCMQRLSKEELLLGTAKGLYVYHKTSQRIQSYDPSQPLFFSDIRSIIVQENGLLWVGTNGSGLLKYNSRNGSLHQYTKSDGLSDNSVYSMLMDKNSNLWMGTNNGLCKFTNATGSFKSFSEKDGITFEEFNTNASCLLSNGDMAFGGISGMILFNPDTFITNLTFPTPILTKLQVNNQPLPLDSSYYFNYDENYLAFQFSALHFFRNEEIQYAYTLEGLDKNWISCGTRHFTTYANLEPGNYVFKVKCTNPHGEWSNHMLMVPFTIRAPWYKTWYFFISVFVLLSYLIYEWLAYKNRQNTKLLQIRENIARDLHDEIGSNLSSISIFNEVAKESINRNKTGVLPVLDKIGEYAQISQEAMGDIVWMIDSKNDRFENILVKMRTYAAETIGASSIKLQLNFDDHLKNIKIEMKQRKNLYLIFKEALNNIQKYADCKNVAIDLFEQNRIITLRIKDDGKGFNPENTKGNGLVNMKKRAEEINGTLDIESSPENGTSIKLVFAL